MGLAPYGRPAFRDAILDRLLRLEDDGGYRLDTALCDYHRALAGDFDPGLADLVGPPRAPDAEPDQDHLDLAASVQAAFEAAQRHLLAWGKAQAPQIDRLVLSGGCALNVTANGRILQSGLFSEVIAPPAPHDAGCAVGAALARGGPARNTRSPYLGPGFTDAEIARTFAERGLPAPRARGRGRADRGRRRGARRGRRRRLVPGPHRVRPARAGDRARSSPIRATTPSARRSTPRSRSASSSAPSPPRRRSRRRPTGSISPRPAPT